nr:SH3 domain-containing protein [Oscillospiraceae bacterium]
VEEEPVEEEPAEEEAPVEEEPVEEEPVEEELPIEDEAVESEPVEEAPVEVEKQIVSNEQPEAEPEEIAVAETPAQAITAAEAETLVRFDADGMSEIFTTLPAGAELNVLGIVGDWVKVQLADGRTGYIYKDQVAGIDFEALQPEQEPAGEEIPETPKKVTIFSSRTTTMRVGDAVYLTSKLEGFEDCAEIYYQWECDKGDGFAAVEGATGAEHAFEADRTTLKWSWRLVVSYR